MAGWRRLSLLQLLLLLAVPLLYLLRLLLMHPFHLLRSCFISLLLGRTLVVLLPLLLELLMFLLRCAFSFSCCCKYAPVTFIENKAIPTPGPVPRRPKATNLGSPHPVPGTQK